MSALDVMRRVLTAYETHDLLGMEAHMQELRGAIAQMEAPAAQAPLDAMKQALEALLGWRDNDFHKFCWAENFNRGQHAIASLRLAIEQAELDELEEGSGGPINDGWQLIVSDGHSKRGVYAYMPEHPEEAVFLMPIEQADRQEPFGYFIHDSQFGSEDFSRLKPEAVNPTETVIALYTAPPQQEKQEPVAWADEVIEDLHALYNSEMIKENDSGDALIRLDAAVCAVEEAAQRHTAQPQPQRQPLTDEQVRDLWSWSATAEAERTATTQQHAFARAIERAHGIGGEHD